MSPLATLRSIDPTNDQGIESFQEFSDAELAEALARAAQAWRIYRWIPVAKRAVWLMQPLVSLRPRRRNGPAS